MDVDAIEQRTGDLPNILLDLDGIAGTLLIRVAVVPTRAELRCLIARSR